MRRKPSIDWALQSLGHRLHADTTLSIGLPFLFISGSEFFLFHGYLETGIIGHLVTLLICTIGPLAKKAETETFRAFLLIPLFRLVNLGLPFFVFDPLLSTLILYGALLPAAILLALDFSVISISLVGRIERVVLALPIIVLLSFFGARIEYQLVNPNPMIGTWTVETVIMFAIVMVGLVAFIEELVFRGILQRNLQYRLGNLSGLIISSLLFGFMHSGSGNLLEVGFAALLGGAYGATYDWTDSLLLAVLFHGLLNIWLFGIMPL